MENQLSKKQLKEQKRLENLARRTNEEHSRNVQRTIIWSVVILAVVGSIWGLVKFGASTINNPNGQSGVPLANPVTKDDWIRGNVNAPVTLVEYSDFQCPACGSAYPVLKQIEKDFGDSLRVVYRHYPLPQHLNSTLAAQAAEAAGKQNKFWEMHDKLFETQTDWSNKTNAEAEQIFAGYAEAFGLDKNKFTQDFNSAEISTKISASRAGGDSSGVNSTPTFFLDGQPLNLKTFGDLQVAIQAKIKK